jgi:hypothetical protein
VKYLGETKIDIRRTGMSPIYRPPWKPVNEKQFDVRLSAFGPRTMLDEDYGKHFKIYTDGSKMGDKVG